MPAYRLTHAGQDDVISILAWSHGRFGEEARKRYEAFIDTAIRDAATRCPGREEGPARAR